MVEKSYKFILVAAGLIFLTIYFSQINNALWHDELIASTYFHQYTPFSPSPEGYLEKSMMDFSKNWRSYFRIYPPGFVSFYIIWAKIVGNNEVALRIPLLLLCLFTLFKILTFLKYLFTKEEAALYTFLLILSPLWYGQGVRLNPETFSLCFSALSFYFFYEYFSLSKKNAYLWLLVINTFWMLFDYFSLLFCIIQYIAIFIGPKKGRSQPLLYLIIGILIFYFLIFCLTTGVQGPNPFMFKWARPELINVYKILQFLSFGRIDE